MLPELVTSPAALAVLLLVEENGPTGCFDTDSSRRDRRFLLSRPVEFAIIQQRSQILSGEIGDHDTANVTLPQAEKLENAFPAMVLRQDIALQRLLVSGQWST